MEKLIIIGSGPAGLTAAIYASRFKLSPLVITGKTPGGQLMSTTYIENWPGNKKIFGAELMTNMKEQAKDLGTRFLEQNIIKTDFSKASFALWTNKNEKIEAKSIIIATGANPKKLNIPGEEEYWAKGVSSCAVCDAPLYKDKKVLVVGGGDSAMEAANFLQNYAKEIIVVHILDKLTASQAMQEKIINNQKIKIIYNSTLSKIEGDTKRVQKAIIKNQKTKEIKIVNVDGIFITIGLAPNIEPFKGQIDINNYGYITTKDNVKTSIPGIFAAGDVADYKYKQAITAAGFGCMAAIEVEKYLNIKNSKK